MRKGSPFQRLDDNNESGVVKKIPFVTCEMRVMSCRAKLLLSYFHLHLSTFSEL